MYELPLGRAYQDALTNAGTTKYLTASLGPREDGAPAFPGTISSLPPGEIPPAPSIKTVSPNYDAQYAFLSNVQIEHALTDNVAVSAAYVNSTGRNLPVGLSVNFALSGNTLPDGRPIYADLQALGIPMEPGMYLTIIIMATLVSIGTAGVPGAGAIMLMMVLESVGLKVEPGSPVAMAYAMIFGIDALLDMGRTACNVTGDLAVTCLVAKSEGQMDISKWVDKETPSPSQSAVLDTSPENP